MNILLITQLFPASSDLKSTSGALREFVLAWAKDGHKIKVIRPYFAYEGEEYPQKPLFRLHENIEVEFIRPLRIPLIKYSYYNKRKIPGKLNFKPDVLVCHLYNSYFTFHSLAKDLNIPLVIGIHNSDIKISKYWFYRLRQRKIFEKAAGFACRSIAVRNSFNQQFPGFEQKTFLAISGLPSDYINRVQVSKRTKTKIKIITVSWLIKRKQIDLVINALSRISSDIDWEYGIVGDGEEEENLRSLVKTLNLSENVRFYGKLTREEVVQELDKNDIFILPSFNETLGLVYLEAMARGCITIGSLNEGIDGIIRDGENGFLCDPRNTQSIFEKLQTAMFLDETQRQKLIRNGFETVNSYTTENKAREYIDQLKNVLR